ncbi:MAG TPA: UbiA family prenyltransferase [Bacteroidia bacterium]|nr:UbiA family prenyltransferase [Bacteroidia bacterium]
MSGSLLPDKNTIRLMRIPFSYLLMPVFLFALSQAKNIDIKNAILSFLALHLLIYPASNGYNSFMDNDTTSIGGLKNPPRPSPKLFYLATFFDACGLIIALLVNMQFFLCTLAYILASRAYSYTGIRLKKKPILGFFTVIFFQGAFTFWMVYNAISKSPIEYTNGFVAALAACSFLIAGVYPLTQVYQHEADFANGDITISYRLGYTGTFVFAGSMFIIASILLFYYFYSIRQLQEFILFQLFLLPVINYFLFWFVKVSKDPKQASFERTMNMNLIASTCMNICFITLLIINMCK